MLADFSAVVRTRSGRRGSILVGVLWIVVFLGLLAVVLRVHISSVVASVRVTEDKAAARAIADAGLARAAAIVLSGPYASEGKVADRIQDSVKTATGTVSVTLTNEAWRIDLNTAEKPLVVGALRAAGAEPQLAEVLAVRILARRGLAAGTEDAGNGQQAAPPDGAPVDANLISTVSETASIEGMPESVALGIMPFTTVSSGLSGVRLDALDDRVLAAIPGLSSNIPGVIARYRRGEITRGQLEQVLAPVTFNTIEQALSWRAILRVELPSGYSETHEALIIISPDDDAPYRILGWRRVTDDVN